MGPPSLFGGNRPSVRKSLYSEQYDFLDIGGTGMAARKITSAIIGALLLLALLPTGATAQEPGHSATDATVTNPDDGTTIAITIFKPAGASADSKVPVILHSHGWGGSRSKTVGGVVQEFLDAGFGVVSIDQRGHGDSGGQANVQDPTKETEDIKAVIDLVATLDWVLQDGKGKRAVANDPVLGAIGGSYGGGYQTMTALDEIADEGRTRFNALAPEITWYDLPESLAPQKVARSAWNTLLYAAGASMVPQYIHEAFAWGSSTGQWPDGTLFGQPVEGVPDLDSEFHKHSPVSFVEKGIRIDVPVLLRQGASDNLFNLNEGINIFDKAVTPQARKSSYFVGYNGGHALPNVLPAGTAAGSDACSPGNFTELTIEFFKRTLFGRSTKGLMPARYNLTTAAGDNCLRLDELGSSDPVAVDPLGTGGVISTAGAGAPLHFPVAEGPVTLGGVPTLSGLATTTALDSRAFFGLAVGTSPADARVIQNNLLPLRQILPGTDQEFKIDLPGVAVEVPEGQSLFLTVSPISDLSFGHGSRVPGAVVLSDVELTLPKT
jgi:ABC-2 type transport system ATP-binding protein